MAALKLNWASECETGRRSANDDCVLVDPENGIYAVCDGASARIGGRTAAELACQVAQQWAPEISRELGGIISEKAPDLAERVLQAAHRTILEAQERNPELSGMTTTIAMVWHRGDEVLLSHVGDSRIYIFREPELRQMTRDHSLENYLKENPDAQPKVKLPGKTLVRALGLKNAQLGARHKRVTLAEGDALLLCSDGLSDAVAPWILREIMAGLPATSAKDLASALVRAALAHGTIDNISAIVLRASEQPDRSARTLRYDFESLSASLPFAGGTSTPYSWAGSPSSRVPRAERSSPSRQVPSSGQTRAAPCCCKNRTSRRAMRRSSPASEASSCAIWGRPTAPMSTTSACNRPRSSTAT